MLPIQLDFHSDQPLYQQLYERVRQQIVTGQIQTGEKLLPVRSLAQQLGINFNTVARAYRLLDTEGLVSMQTGRGSYLMTAPQEKPLVSLSNPDRQDALKELTGRCLLEALRLGYNPAEVIVMIGQQVDDWESGAMQTHNPGKSEA
jgi:GntR family transcriptional regulator